MVIKMIVENTPMKKGKLILLIIPLVLCSLAVSAFAQPQLPCSFYGNAVINNRNAPVGSIITAEINGLVKGSIILDSEGKYGGETALYGKLLVQDGNDGDTINFYIQTPQMSNKIKASETATWVSGEISKLDLTFTGEEIAKTETTGNTGSPSGAQANQETNEETQNIEQNQIQGTVYNIDENFKTSDNVTLKISKNDEIIFTFENEQHSIKLKSMSDFAVLLTISSDPFDVIVGVKETKNVDLNGDNSDDISIKLNSIKDSKADITITKLKKEPQESPKTMASTGMEGVTGMMFASNAVLNGLIIAVIIIVIAIGFYIHKRKGRGTAWRVHQK